LRGLAALWRSHAGKSDAVPPESGVNATFAEWLDAPGEFAKITYGEVKAA